MSATPVHHLCLATAVNATALARLLEDGDVGGFRDAHPWYVAAELLEHCRERGETLLILLASGQPPCFTRWAEVRDIEVHSLASSRETRVRFGRSGEVNPIFQDLDAVALPPTAQQARREEREGLRHRRVHLDAQWLSPYAICETPAFLLARAGD